MLEFQTKLDSLEEADRTMKDDIAQMKQQKIEAVNSPTTPSVVTTAGIVSPPPSSNMPGTSSALPSPTRKDGLPQDVFTLMMISPYNSQAWVLGYIYLCLSDTPHLFDSYQPIAAVYRVFRL
uniref:Uncharacterized protein n=1 Tax=Chaetoceros debilis TaxID=122233 RepID=A0A7S3PYQ2_9STRA|mmetsp:Transcript_28615/g.43776  ORF Transcript_28615/g.43776 Transcript_28615/m.43776 type:complete len:122 (+) Transcript_28615:173-538(+)